MENRINLQPASSAFISQKQSLELVRILIITVFSGVLWRRRVFPGVRYKFRVFDPADPRASYDTFVNEGGQTSTADLNCWPILPRSDDPRTEKLLNLLQEKGVKEALEIGTLSRLQLSFHSSNGAPASADNLLESYTLGFAYRDGIELTELTAETGNSANRKITFSLSTVKQQVEYINHQLQCLMQTTRNKSELLGPGRFRMFLRMKYVGNDDYCPTGFHQDQESLQLLNDAHLDLNMRMITGYHSILAGTHLPVKPVARSTSSTFAITSRLRVASKADLNAIQAGQHQNSSQSTQTQPKNVEKVDAMGIFRNSTDPRSTQLLNASSLSASQESHAAANNENMLVNSTQYGQGVIELIKQIERSQGPDTNSQEDSFAACECGINLLHEKIEFQLARTINCELCGGHRHLECYGYLNEKFPEAFVCYSCLKLNFPEHHTTLKRATSLCIRRRVLNYFLNQGSLMAIKDLAEFTGSSSKRIISILNTMKREKILAGSEKRKTEGRPLFTLIDPKNLKFVRDKYFNPRIGMEIFMSQPTHLAQNASGDIPSTPHQQVASSNYFSVPSHIQRLETTEDDDSTQGVPSPQLADRSSKTLHVPVKPAGKTHEDDLPLGTKRKTTPTKNNAPKRVKLAHATPLMSRRIGEVAFAGSPWEIEHDD